MANFLSVIANMFRSGGRYNITKRPTPKKRQTYKPYTREEISKVESTSRLPQFMQREVYKADPKLAKRVAQLTPKALEARPFVAGAMNVTGQDIIKKLEASTGQDIDTKKVEQSALWKAGNIAGEVANFALTGGAAGGAVTNLITKGAKLGTIAKLGANVGGEAIAATPYNVTQAATTALGSKNPEKEFAKNLAINTALDVGIGGAIGVAPLIVKALKKVPDTKPIGDALEKGGYVKDAVDAEKKITQSVSNIESRNLDRYKRTGIKTTVPKTISKKVYVNAQSDMVGKATRPVGRLALPESPKAPNEFYFLWNDKLYLGDKSGFVPTSDPNILIKENVIENKYDSPFSALNITTGERWGGDSAEKAIEYAQNNSHINLDKFNKKIALFESGKTLAKPSNIKNLKKVEYKPIEVLERINRDKGQQFVKSADGTTSVKFTPKELKRLKGDNEYYKTGYLTTMTPDDFLGLTSNQRTRESFQKEIQNNSYYSGGKLKKSGIDREFMFLEVDPKTWTVTGHEGRHRMMLLKDAGIKDIDILIRFPKYEGNTVPFNNVTLNPQKFGDEIVGDKQVTLSELSPLSGDLSEQTIAKYSAPKIQPKKLNAPPSTLPPAQQQAIRNLQQRKLKAGSTVTQPLPTAQQVTPQVAPQPKAPTTPIKKTPKLPSATIMSKVETEKKINLLKEFIADARLRGVDTFTPQEDFARQLQKTNFKEGERLLAKINSARTANEKARNWITFGQRSADGTKELGESLTSIMDRIPADKEDLFQEYLFTKHHIDRLAKGKPILGLTKSQSIKRIQDIFNSLTPAEKKLFNDTDLLVRDYIGNLRQYGIDTGLITKQQVDLFEQMYPNYIKTARDKGSAFVTASSTSNPSVKNIFKKASRSDDPILPLREQLKILTNDYVVTGQYNDMIRELAKARGVATKGTAQKLGNSLTVTNQLGSDGERNFITFFDNGKEYKMPVSNLEAKSYKILMQGGWGKEGMSKVVGDVLTPINTWFKLPITGVNPIFMAKNFARDFADALFYTKDIKGFLKNYPSAYKELAEKGDYYKLYQGSGGKYSTFSYLDENLKDKRSLFTKTFSQRVEDANSYIEQIPRMTEFMNVIKKELNGKPLSDVTGDMINKASLAAAEITTNFGRSGDFGKYLNRTGVPFLNPSIQGGSRLIRQLTGQDGFKGYMRLAMKAVTLGMIPAVVNEMAYGDDPEYQQLRDRDKEINFVFKIENPQTGEHYWLKMPRGRVMSVMGMIPQALMGKLKGDEYDFAELFSVVGGQIGPVNPKESNIFSPLWQAATNTTWYGGKIDGQQWDDVKKSERYDATTSSIGKFLGGLGFTTFGADKVNLSPRQWDYVIDGYTGIFGDTILPFLREDKTKRNSLKQAFMLDPATQNDLSTNFYKLYDDVTVLSQNPTQEEKLAKRFMERYRAKTNEIVTEIRNIQKDNIPDAQKESEIAILREQLNNMYSNAEFQLNEFKGFVGDSISKFGDEEKGYQDAVISAQLESGGDEWKTYTMFMQGNKKDNYNVAKKAGIDAKSYYELFDGRLDTDASGGINQEEAQAVLDSMDFTNEQKSVLWGIINKGWKKNPYKGDTTGGGSRSGGSTRTAAKKYRDGLATSQVKALENLTVQSPNLTSAEIKAIIKMLSA